MPDPGRVDAPTGRVDDPGAVAVRDHPGKGHLGSQPAATFLGVTGIHSWEPDPHPDLTRIGHRVWIYGAQSYRRTWPWICPPTSPTRSARAWASLASPPTERFSPTARSTG